MKINKSLLIGIMAGLFVSSGIGYAANQMNINVWTKNVTFVLNGTEVKTGDHEGLFYNGKANVPEAFVFEGTTYVPLRLLGELLGKRVSWEEATNTISINDTEGLDLVKKESAPYEIQQWVDQSLKAESKQIKAIGGKTYILVTRGQKNTAGYDVKIKSVEENEKEIVIKIENIDPKPGSFRAQVITYPYALASVDKIWDKPVRFVEE